MKTLRPYQVDDLARLINDPRTGLFHSPGGGKTPIAAYFTRYLWEQTKNRIVWTQPGGLLEKNRTEILDINYFEPEEVQIVQGPKPKRLQIMNDPRVKVFLMSGVGYANEFELLPENVRHAFHDEIQLYYVTHNAKRTQNWYRACRNKHAIVPMTGTIIRGRLDSAYPVLHVLAPQYYGNDRAFLQHHAIMDEFGKVIGWKNHERLAEILNRIGIFRSFKSIYGEEQKVIQVQRCKVTPEVMTLYKKLEETALIELEDEFVDGSNPAVAAMRARQLLSCPDVFDLDVGQTGKEQALEVEIEDHIKTGERLAIFSVFEAEQERIAKLINSFKGSVGLINGGTSYNLRAQIDKDFNAGNLQFVVASPATAGIGFNWEFLNTMVFMSVDYMDDSFIQAYRRGIRGKREQPLLIKLYKYEDTIEDRMFQIIDRKSRDHHLVNPELDALNLSEL